VDARTAACECVGRCLLQPGCCHFPDAIGYLFWCEVRGVQDQVGATGNPESGVRVPRYVIESPGHRNNLDLIGFDAAPQGALLSFEENMEDLMTELRQPCVQFPQ
jgi:hypothetical protein